VGKLKAESRRAASAFSTGYMGCVGEPSKLAPLFVCLLTDDIDKAPQEIWVTTKTIGLRISSLGNCPVVTDSIDTMNGSTGCVANDEIANAGITAYG